MSIIKGKTNTVAGVGKNGTGFTLFTPIWQDHLVNNASWLRADTFSWQSGAVYVAAYNHLATEVNEQYVQMYSFTNDVGNGCMALSPNPAVGDPLWGYSPLFNFGHVISVSENSITYHDDTTGGEVSVSRNASGDGSALKIYRDVIGTSIIYFVRAADGHKVVLPDQENNVMSIYNATGIAWYYILDTTNQRFKLPRNKYGFTGFRDNVGNYVAPGLPNITGSIDTVTNPFYNPSLDATGALSGSKITNVTAQNSGAGYPGTGVALDASKSNHIYGSSDTVQPPAVETYLYFFVGNTVEEVTTINVGQLTESLNGKADTSLNNVPTNYDYVVESGQVGGTWYRVYKSGWLEQGGGITPTEAWSTVTLLKPYATSGYVITGCVVNGNTAAGVTIKDKTVTSFSIYQNVPQNWFSCGQGAS